MASNPDLTRLLLDDNRMPVFTVSILGAGLLLLLVYRAYLHPLARFPGPRIAALTGLWRTYHYAIGDWHLVIAPLHQKYGRVVRLAPNELSIVDEMAMKTLFGHGTTAIKANWYRAWQPPKAAPNILATQDEKAHTEIRRRIAPAFKMVSILKLEQYMQICFDNLWDKLRGPASRDEVVDMCHWTNALAFDVIGELCYGEPLGLLEGTDAMNIQHTLFANFVISSVLGHVWGQLSWVDNIFTRLLNVENPVQQVVDWSSEKVHQHFETKGGGNHRDLIDYFVEYRDSKGNQSTHPEVVDSAVASIGAGADTISTAMRSCLYFLGIHPEVHQKLQSEIDSLCHVKITDSITYTETQQMPYLKAVVRESLRMLPSIPAQLYRYVPENGINVEGQHIAAGTMVGISASPQNRDKAIFGENADEFLPERWLGDEARARYMETAMFNFGGTGPRSCSGRDLAMVELHKFVAQMVHKFDFELVDKERPFKTRTYFFSFQSDMWMKIRLRSADTIIDVKQ